jgi:hypothetical protein
MTDRTRRLLAELDPKAIPVFTAFIAALDTELTDMRYIVFEGRRSPKVQAAYYAQGREPLVAVNAKRAEADNYQITWTLKSRHIDGLAMDVLPVDGCGNPTWDLSHYRQQFTAIAKCARDAGLECGADWPAPKTDWPHYEIKEG